ncbi:MAG: protein kinase [Planctomycetes bacterium]|nr:protein kinase [Planctomycetota bacterium]
MPLPLPEDVAPHAEDPSRRLGRYVLAKRIGKGGQSEVWRAWDTVLARHVAVKILKDADAEDVVRFRREANILANLHHPNIAPVFAMEQEGSRAYIAMQLVDGETVDRLNAPLPRKLEHVRDAARALHFAHKQGIIHRDIKPSNIMATTDGHLFLLDFGIARPVRKGATITGTDFLVGTPAYMAPEQARGGRCDERTDVYALGATLYRLATHSDPFYGDDPMQVLLKVSNEAPPRPRTLEPTIPKPVEDIIRIAMAKEPEGRYPSAEAFAEQIDAHLTGKRVRAAPRDPIKIPPGVWIGVLAVIAAAAVAFAIFRPPPPRPVAPNPPPAAVIPADPPDSASDHALMAARDLLDQLRQPGLKPEVRDRCAKDARGLIAGILKADPGHAAALFELTKLESLLGNADAALKAADRAVDADKESAPATLLRARLRIKQALALKVRHIATLEPLGDDAPSTNLFLEGAASDTPEIHRLFQGAEADLARFRALSPSAQAADLAFARGLTQFNNSRFKDAARSLAAAADSPWLGTDARLLLGIASYFADDFKSGEAALLQAGAGNDLVETRLLLAILLQVEAVRTSANGGNPAQIYSLIAHDFEELAKVRPKSADWVALVPMKGFWLRSFKPWLDKGR